ncbi:MAG: NUDIX hydrolase [Oscillospiraceae bacterium]|nr:NUDIX hydrolase [Oscillospiraceae bacterium]
MKEEKTLTTEYHFRGVIMNVRKDTVECPDGRVSTREVCEHCDGVAVLPVTDDGEAILVSQFRYPFKKEITEAPAGKVDPGEGHLECAVRELSEETGYTAENLSYLGFVYPSPGCFTERIHLYIARGLSEGDAHPDEGEILEVRKYKLQNALDMVLSGEISDAKTQILILRAARELGF